MKFFVKAKQNGKTLTELIANSIFIAFSNQDLDITNTIRKVPTKTEFFNLRPIVLWAKQEAEKKIASYCTETIEGGIESYSGYSDPDILLSIYQDTRELKNGYINYGLVIAIEETKPNFIKPVFKFLGTESYAAWAFIYTVIDKFLSEYNQQLDNMNIEVGKDVSSTEVGADDIKI